MKTPWDIHYEAFLHAGGIYTEKHARLYADLANDLIADGSFSILYEGVAHACYTPIILAKAPQLTCFILAPLAVLPEYQNKGYATRLMEEAEKQLQADAIFVLGDPMHYARRYDTPHEVSFPIPTNAPLDCWFARELTQSGGQGILAKVGKTPSSISGPFANPIMWKEPSEQV